MNMKEQIKMLLETGIPKQNIAETFNMSIAEIDRIISSEQTKTDAAPIRKRIRGVRYDEEKFNEGKKLRAQGWTFPRIAKYQGFSTPFVYKALQNETYADVEEMREKERIYKASLKEANGTKRQPGRKPERKPEQAAETVHLEPTTGKAETKSEAKEVIEQKNLVETLAKHTDTSGDRMYIEIRSIADSLARIAEALESKKKKKGLFRR